MTFRRLLPTLALCVSSLGAACGDSGAPTDTDPVVVSVAIDVPRDTLRQGATVQLAARVRDASGQPLSMPAVQWRSADTTVAVVNTSGSLTGRGRGRTFIHAEAGGKKDSLAVEVRIGWRSVSIGSVTLVTCGLAFEGKAYCWGDVPHPHPGFPLFLPDSVPGGLRFTSIAMDQTSACGTTASGALYCWDGVPRPVSSPVPLVSVVAGRWHYCGLSAEGRAYCWGTNDVGQLGTGSRTAAAIPTAVQGAYRFTSLNAGMLTTCGITTAQEAVCWGDNAGGQIGNGSSGDRATVPTRVNSTQSFRSVNPSTSQSCGLTTGGEAMCWGFGPLGNVETETRPTPGPVAGGQRFVQMSAGDRFTCGLTEAGTVYCWGLAVGPADPRGPAVPTPVAGAPPFKTIAAGGSTICGLTSASAMYCWGRYPGDGTSTRSERPTLVAEPR